jgi:hypothetical protein
MNDIKLEVVEEVSINVNLSEEKETTEKSQLNNSEINEIKKYINQTYEILEKNIKIY